MNPVEDLLSPAPKEKAVLAGVPNVSPELVVDVPRLNPVVAVKSEKNS